MICRITSSFNFNSFGLPGPMPSAAEVVTAHMGILTALRIAPPLHGSEALDCHAERQLGGKTLVRRRSRYEDASGADASPMVIVSRLDTHPGRVCRVLHIHFALFVTL
jgi:hypothetical protein